MINNRQQVLPSCNVNSFIQCAICGGSGYPAEFYESTVCTCAPPILWTTKKQEKEMTHNRQQVPEKCPNCDDTGCYPEVAARDRDGQVVELQPVQCEFCYCNPNSVFNVTRKQEIRT